MRNVLSGLSVCLLAGGCLSGSTNHHTDGTNGSGSGTTTGTGNNTSGSDGGATSPASSACGQQTFAISATAVPPNVYFVVDRSGSMTQDFGGGTTGSKWDAAQAALKGLLTDNVGKARWGLSLFPHDPAPGDVCTAAAIDVPLAAGDEQALLTMVNAISDDDINTSKAQTPTADSMATVRDSAMLDDTTRGNFVVLMTDGEPNCGDPTAVAPAIAQLFARTPSVKTFIVGLGSDTASKPATLNAWAEAGGTALTGATEYYQANNASDLVTAFSSIIGLAASCSFHLSTTPPDPTLVVGTLDGVAQANSTTDGYTYDASSQTLVFSGAACTSITAGKVKSVGADYGCPPAPIK